MPPPDLEPVALEVCKAQGFAFEGRAGAGTFKQTFRVRDGSDVRALKVYLPGHSNERARREIEAMTRCNHPNIARILRIESYVSALGTHTFSLEEFLPGGNLSARLQTGLFVGPQVETLTRPLLSAIEHMASLQLVHRDIKPDNLMLRQDGITPVVVDFGLVRDLTAVSITPTWVMQGPGTPLFAPAEQLTNKKALIDWRADQFSLGVVFSYCIFGFHPYSEATGTDFDTVNRVARFENVAQRFLDAATAAGYPALVRMCSPWPYQRFTRPDALIRAWGL